MDAGRKPAAGAASLPDSRRPGVTQLSPLPSPRRARAQAPAARRGSTASAGVTPASPRPAVVAGFGRGRPPSKASAPIRRRGGLAGPRRFRRTRRRRCPAGGRFADGKRGPGRGGRIGPLRRRRAAVFGTPFQESRKNAHLLPTRFAGTDERPRRGRFSYRLNSMRTEAQFGSMMAPVIGDDGIPDREVEDRTEAEGDTDAERGHRTPPIGVVIPEYEEGFSAGRKRRNRGHLDVFRRGLIEGGTPLGRRLGVGGAARPQGRGGRRLPLRSLGSRGAEGDGGIPFGARS